MKLLSILLIGVGSAFGHDDLLIDEDRRELGYTDCGRTSKTTVKILMEHECRDPDNIPNTEIGYLRKGFFMSYNDLNDVQNGGEVCDGKCRRYAAVPSSITRGDVYKKDGGATCDMIYTVDIYSTGCSHAFDFGVARRDLLTRTSFVPQPLPVEKYYPLPTADTCECPPKAQIRGITETEFENHYNTFLKQMQYGGRLDILGPIVHATELEEVPCVPTEPFVAQVEVDVHGTRIESTLNIPKFEREFKDTFNDLNQHFCDPCFRVIHDVTVVDEEPLRTRHGRDLSGTRLVGNAKGKCRKKSKCKKKVFNDGNRRALQPLVPVDPERRKRRHLGDGKCYCPTDPEAQRGMTSMEFTEALDEATDVKFTVVEVANASP